ncbi:MAG: HAD family phosphatase [Anaerolineales bacterium]|nr:HAD family phosphatase [Anaerolineales bacterium]
MSIRAVILDFGSVLVHMVDETPRRELAERLNIPLERLYQLVFDSQTAVRAMVGEISIDQHWEAVRHSLGVQPAEWPAFIRQFWAADWINEPLIAYVRTLRPQYKIGLLSNAWNDLRHELEARFAIADLFDAMIISAEVGLAKPDPRIYRLAVERLGVQPGEAIFIDDRLENVLAARQEGLYAIHYQDHDDALYELKDILHNKNIM